jgi:hypothetical protein
LEILNRNANQVDPAEVMENGRDGTPLTPRNVVRLVGAYIEDQYLKKANPDTLKKLGRAGGRWEEACVSAGLEVTYVHASVWQQAVLRGAMTRNRAMSDERKRASVGVVRGRYGVDMQDDEADATMLATWAAELLWFERRKEAASGRARPR